MTPHEDVELWPRAALKDLVDERGITYGVVQPGRPVADGVPLVRVNNFAGTRLVLEDVLRIAPEVDARHGRSRLRGGEVLLTLVGTTGQIAVVGEQLRGWNVARAVGVIPLRQDVPARWVAWCLETPGVRAFLDARANTTVQKTLNLRDVGTLSIPMPPTAHVNAIAEILGPLDEKIDSNRRLVALLEETSAGLFRARFVDFVGVVEFEESDIGPVPAGWSAGSLTDLGEFVNGRAFTKNAVGTGRPIIRIRELNNGIDAQTLRDEIAADEKNIARTDDILFAWSGSLDVYRWPGEEALVNQHIFKVIPKGVPAWFVYSWIQQHMRWFKGIAADKATTMGHIQRKHLSEAAVPLPTSDALEAADREIGPLDAHRARLVAETRTLAALRDELLPKLISGEIRVPTDADAEAVREAVAA